MKYMLSPAAEDDVETVFRLNKELIDKYENVNTINYERVLAQVRDGIARSILDYRRIIYGGETAGFILVEKHLDRTELDDLFLFPKFQNKGIGTALVSDIIRSSDTPVFLFVFIENEGAVRLYRRLGFEIVGTFHETRYRMMFGKR